MEDVQQAGPSCKLIKRDTKVSDISGKGKPDNKITDISETGEPEDVTITKVKSATTTDVQHKSTKKEKSASINPKTRQVMDKSQNIPKTQPIELNRKLIKQQRPNSPPLYPKLTKNPAPSITNSRIEAEYLAKNNLQANFRAHVDSFITIESDGSDKKQHPSDCFRPIFVREPYIYWDLMPFELRPVEQQGPIRAKMLRDDNDFNSKPTKLVLDRKIVKDEKDKGRDMDKDEEKEKIKNENLLDPLEDNELTGEDELDFAPDYFINTNDDDDDDEYEFSNEGKQEGPCF